MTDSVKQAAHWLAVTPEAEKPHPIIPHIRERFGLSAMQAIEAINQARLIRARAT